MKRNLLILAFILLIGFIVNSCGDDEEKECSICKSGQHCYTHCVNENCNVHDCKNHNKTTCEVCNPKCKCLIKEHLGIDETKCDGFDCECVLQSYGELFEDSGIKIYRIGKVEDFSGGTPIATAVANAQAGYAGLESDDKNDFTGKVTEIHIYPATEGASNFFYRNEGGKLIVGLRVNRGPVSMGGVFAEIARNELAPTVVAAHNVRHSFSIVLQVGITTPYIADIL